MIKELLKKSLKQVVKPVNVLIFLINILLYTVFVIIFFWYVIAVQFEILIKNKVKLLYKFVEHNEDIKESIRIYINNTSNELANVEYNNRNNFNINLLLIYLMPFVYVLASLLILLIIYIIYKKIKLTRTDYLLILFIPCGFISEIIFYFIVISQWQYIGNFEVINILISN